MKKVRVDIITDYDEDTKASYLVQKGEYIRFTKTFIIRAKDVWSCNDKNMKITSIDNINIQIKQRKEYEQEK